MSSSHASAVALLLPAGGAGFPAEARELVESVRREHDPAFARWPPHVNVVWPFVPPETDLTFSPQVVAVCARALASAKRDADSAAASSISSSSSAARRSRGFGEVRVRFARFGMFDRGASARSTVYLAVDDDGGLEPVRKALASAFKLGEQSGGGSSGGDKFTPHLTVALAPRAQAKALMERLQRKWDETFGKNPPSLEVESLQLISRSATGRFAVRAELPLPRKSQAARLTNASDLGGASSSSAEADTADADTPAAPVSAAAAFDAQMESLRSQFHAQLIGLTEFDRRREELVAQRDKAAATEAAAAAAAEEADAQKEEQEEEEEAGADASASAGGSSESSSAGGSATDSDNDSEETASESGDSASDSESSSESSSADSSEVEEDAPLVCATCGSRRHGSWACKRRGRTRRVVDEYFDPFTARHVVKYESSSSESESESEDEQEGQARRAPVKGLREDSHAESEDEEEAEEEEEEEEEQPDPLADLISPTLTKMSRLSLRLSALRDHRRRERVMRTGGGGSWVRFTPSESSPWCGTEMFVCSDAATFLCPECDMTLPPGELRAHISSSKHPRLNVDMCFNCVMWIEMEEEEEEGDDEETDARDKAAVRDLLDALAAGRGPPIVAYPDLEDAVESIEKDVALLERVPKIERDGLWYRTLNQRGLMAARPDVYMRAWVDFVVASSDPLSDADSDASDSSSEDDLGGYAYVQDDGDDEDAAAAAAEAAGDAVETPFDLPIEAPVPRVRGRSGSRRVVTASLDFSPAPPVQVDTCGGPVLDLGAAYGVAAQAVLRGAARASVRPPQLVLNDSDGAHLDVAAYCLSARAAHTKSLLPKAEQARQSAHWAYKRAKAVRKHRSWDVRAMKECIQAKRNLTRCRAAVASARCVSDFGLDTMKRVVGEFPADFKAVSEAAAGDGCLADGAAPPDTPGPESLGAVLVARVLHFLPPEELQAAVKVLFDWLRPGGIAVATAETPYLGNWTKFSRVYAGRVRAEEPFPGFVEDVRAYEDGVFADILPAQMHLLDPTVLTRVFTEAGFTVLRCATFARPEFASALQLDGRESVGIVALKPDGGNDDDSDDSDDE